MFYDKDIVWYRSLAGERRPHAADGTLHRDAAGAAGQVRRRPGEAHQPRVHPAVLRPGALHHAAPGGGTTPHSLLHITTNILHSTAIITALLF